jgi:hypothetical protein
MMSLPTPRIVTELRRCKALLLLLLASLSARVVLVLGGGQLFFHDEGRFHRCRAVLRHLAKAQLGGACDDIYRSPEHCFFTVLSAVPTLVQSVVMKLSGRPLDYAQYVEYSWVSALLLALASVAAIALTYAVARRAGGDEREGLTAALLMACAGSMLIYARHLLPYDCALALALLALWLGLDPRPGPGRRVLAGFVAGLALLTYWGYWILAGTVAAVVVLHDAPSVGAVLRRGLAVGLGLITPVVLFFGVGLARGLHPLRDAADFSGTVNQGDFAEGWSLPWAYLWHLEHGLLGVWAVAALGFLWRPADPARAAVGSARRRGLAWLAAAAAIYAGLAVGSTAIHKFVVYGRLARQLVPFLCLAAAAALTWLLQERRLSPTAAWVATAALVAQSVAGSWPAFVAEFPREVVRRVEAAYGPVARALTFAPVPVEGNTEANRDSRYVLTNAQCLFYLRSSRPRPPGDVLFRVRHPQQWFALQYEGLSPAEREILRVGDASQALIDVGAPGPGRK